MQAIDAGCACGWPRISSPSQTTANLYPHAAVGGIDRWIGVAAVWTITESSWDNLLGMMRRKEIDILPAIYYPKEREQFLNYTEPYARVTEFIYSRDETEWISTLDDLKGKSVAVVKGYTVEAAR